MNRRLKTKSNYNYKISLAKILEKWLFAILASLYKVRDGFKVWHINWKRYNYGKGVDLKVFEIIQSIKRACKGNMTFGKPKIKLNPFIHIEAKHWNWFNRPYGTKVVIDEIINRFEGSKAKFKVLIISFKDLISKKGLELLKKHNIHVFEVGKIINHNDFPRKDCSNARFFFETKEKIAQFLNSVQKQAEKVVHYVRLSKYVRLLDKGNNNRCDTKLYKKLIYNTLTHDTQINPNSVIQLIFSHIKPKRQRKTAELL